MPQKVRDRYWEHRGYISGTCMFHDPTRLCYLNIPKNASTFLKENLIKHEWVMLHNSVRRVRRETTNTIVILRDPIDRWFTGIAQHITTNLFGKDYGSSHFLEQANELTNRLIVDQVVFDDHTEQQSWFIEEFGQFLINPTYFYCDQHLNKNLDHWFTARNLDYQLSNQAPVNVSKHSYDNKNLIDYFKNIVYNNTMYEIHLAEHYQQDYDLISTVPFYRDGEYNK
jgi:hypothetical protein